MKNKYLIKSGKFKKILRGNDVEYVLFPTTPKDNFFKKVRIIIKGINKGFKGKKLKINKELTKDSFSGKFNIKMLREYKKKLE